MTLEIKVVLFCVCVCSVRTRQQRCCGTPAFLLLLLMTAHSTNYTDEHQLTSKVDGTYPRLLPQRGTWGSGRSRQQNVGKERNLGESY